MNLSSPSFRLYQSGPKIYFWSGLIFWSVLSFGNVLRLAFLIDSYSGYPIYTKETQMSIIRQLIVFGICVLISFLLIVRINTNFTIKLWALNTLIELTVMILQWEYLLFLILIAIPFYFVHAGLGYLLSRSVTTRHIDDALPDANHALKSLFTERIEVPLTIWMKLVVVLYIVQFLAVYLLSISDLPDGYIGSSHFLTLLTMRIIITLIIAFILWIRYFLGNLLIYFYFLPGFITAVLNLFDIGSDLDIIISNFIDILIFTILIYTTTKLVISNPKMA